MAVSSAQELAYLMLRTTTCMVPQPRFIKVRDLLPSASSVYTPDCVVLHRCAADTGCCNQPNYVCSPKTIQQAIVYIYVSSSFRNLFSTFAKFTAHKILQFLSQRQRIRLSYF